MYSSAACFQTVFNGSVLAMCHQLMVTGLPDDEAPEDDLEVLSSPPPHPATSRAAAAVTATAQRIDFTILLLLRQLCSAVLWRSTSVVAISTRRSSPWPSTR